MRKSFISLLIPALLFGCTSHGLPPDAEHSNVILLTLDGIRWQEFFGDTPDRQLAQSAGVTDMRRPFEGLWRELAAQGVVYGDPNTPSVMRVANFSALSLPAYHNILLGSLDLCITNHCGRIGAETLQERITRLRGFDSLEVVTLASWRGIAEASEHRRGVHLVNAGPVPFEDPHGNSPEIIRINAEMEGDRGPTPEARWDRHTFGLAMDYLTRHRPRFLYIALNDADEHGHHGDYAAYVRSLHEYDDNLLTLVRTLDRMGEYGRNTTLLVTTDHGRGSGARWTSHGGNPEAIPVWAYARGPRVEARGVLDDAVTHTHLDIRPTIERLFGVCSPGTVFKEVLGSGDESAQRCLADYSESR